MRRNCGKEIVTAHKVFLIAEMDSAAMLRA